MNTATRIFIEANLNADVSQLALRTAPPDVDLKCALRQIEARQLLRRKVPSWAGNADLLFADRLPLEQCSSELTARWKASLLTGKTLVDLTGGLGIDSYFISQNFELAHYVEQNETLCECAKHNFEVLKTNIQTHNCTAEQFIGSMSACDAVFIDPARRDTHGHKTVSIADCTPDIAELQDSIFEKTGKILVKLSPMLDISKAMGELKHVASVHVVSVENECKELLFVLDKSFGGQPTIVCVNFGHDGQPRVFESGVGEEQSCQAPVAQTVGRYLYEPDSSIMKAGLFKTIACRFGLEKLHTNSHLYTADHLVGNFNGRVFEVESSAEFGKGVRSQLLGDVERANITARNFIMSADELRRKLKLADGGDCYLFATTLNPNRKVLIRTKKIY